MGSKADLLFGRIAAEEGYLTEAQVRTLAETQERARKAGESGTLGDLARQQGLMTPEQVQHVLLVQEFRSIRAEAMRLGALAVKNGFLTEEHVQAALQHQHQEFLRSQTTLPLGQILLARHLLSEQQLSALLTAQDRLIKQQSAQGAPVAVALSRHAAASPATVTPAQRANVPPTTPGARSQESSMEMVDILRTAVANGASDVIVTAGSPPMFRIDGALVAATGPSLTHDAARSLVFGILHKAQTGRFEKDLELDFALTVEGLHRFRASVYCQRGCVGACFRLVANRIPSMQELGLPKILEEFASAPQGLMLVTGPTGHGKSTTQATMIDFINSRTRAHIVTVEDPIEFLHQNKKAVIDQREVGGDTRGFANALRTVLRQSPDVILIGELRDLESISAALTVAETGHLVFATLHTNDSVQAIDRLIDVFPSDQQAQVRAQLSMGLLAVTAQRLIPRANGKGRALAMEVLRSGPAIRNLIREGKTQQIYTIMETSGREGMKTMDAALKELFHQGAITREEAQSRMRSPETLRTQ